MILGVNGEIIARVMPKKEKEIFKKIAEWIINGRKISLWEAKDEKKLYMNLKGSKLFVYKISNNGEDEVDLKKGKTTVMLTKADKREILFNLQKILKKEKRTSIKLIIQNIFDRMKQIPIN